MTARLNVNIDHIATVRQARRAPEPSLVAAAMLCEGAGADGITIHLRSDRRHIQDDDLHSLRRVLTTYLNVEMAASSEMIEIAVDGRPDAVTLVPENPNEITTEGGLNVEANLESIRECVVRLKGARIFTSLFIDPDIAQIEAARDAGAEQIELCTANYADATQGSRATHSGNARAAEEELRKLTRAAMMGRQYGLEVAAGHGLTYRNVGPLSRTDEITEFNIGHNIIARALFVGIEGAVREMLDRIRER